MGGNAVLAFHSPVFATLFTTSMIESTLNCVTIDNITHNIFYQIMSFIYIGNVTLCPSNVDELKNLLIAAHQYQIS